MLTLGFEPVNIMSYDVEKYKLKYLDYKSLVKKLKFNQNETKLKILKRLIVKKHNLPELRVL